MKEPRKEFLELFEGGLSKSERTRIAIARAAIESYAGVGAEQTNFDRVAKAAGVTRPLVQHYFGSREALFAFVVKYVRTHAQAFGRERVAKMKRKGVDAELRAFLETCLDWVREHPAHVKVMLLLQYSATIDPELRELNTETAHLIHQALSGVLLRSRLRADFAGAITSARMIQHFLMGAVISRVSEERPAPEADFRKEVIRRCLELAG